VTLVFLPAGSFDASTFLVTKTVDTADAVCDSDCSLREAVGAANANVGSDEITIPAGDYPTSVRWNSCPSQKPG